MIPNYFMINSRKFGVPDQVCTLHARTLNNTKSYIQTALGTSTKYYTSTEEGKIYDQGQGVVSSGTSWKFISVPMMTTLEKINIGCNIISPKKNIIAFVDDKILYANNGKVNRPKLINAQLEQAANNCNELLTTISGGLELTKFSHDTCHWRFNNDGTVTTSESYDNIEIKVTKTIHKKHLSYLD